MRLRYPRLLPLLLALGMAMSGCPSFHGREGILHEAIIKDLHAAARKNGCGLNAEEWEKYCAIPAEMMDEGMEVSFPNQCASECQPPKRRK